MTCDVQMLLSDGTEQQAYGRLLQSLSQVEWRLFLLSDHPRGRVSHGSSVIDELFAFQMLTGRICDTCHQLSVSTQPSYILTLPLPATSPSAHPQTTHVVNVDECLRQFSATERLDTAHCDRCARNRIIVNKGCDDGRRNCMEVGNSEIFRKTTHVARASCQRRSMLRYCPPYLVIQLMRFDAHSKRTCRVAVPRRLLLGNDVVMGDDDDAGDYELVALCCHVDGHVISGGHYVACATADRVTWYEFDDVTVTRVNIDAQLQSERLQRNVYLLFYRRRVIATS